MKAEKETLVLGVGNLLLKDEGVGIHVIKALENEKLPAHVHLMDGGTGGLHLLSWLQGYDRIIMIDAAPASRRKSPARREGRSWCGHRPSDPTSLRHRLSPAYERPRDRSKRYDRRHDPDRRSPGNPSHCHLRPQYQRGRNGSDTRGKGGGSESDPDDTRDYFNT